jgi:UTP--glucose-1-phosphate uridylyltransferase
MSIRKAIITCAGYGTRFLPITKTIQKEMLPILNRPTIDYTVEDCIKAGIEEIIFVVKEGEVQVQNYYSENPRLYQYLVKMGKEEQYKNVEHLHTQAKFTFVVQKDSEVYGTGTPVKLAQEYVKNEEAFLVLMGDDFIYNADGSSNSAAMIKLFEKTGSAAVMSCLERPTELLHKYGIAEVDERAGEKYLKTLVEKPKPGTAPSNLANLSKYIFTPQVFDILATQKVNAQTGEFFITDTVLELAQKAPVVIHTPKGAYVDSGFPLEWLKANLLVAKDKPELASELKQFIATW